MEEVTTELPCVGKLAFENQDAAQGAATYAKYLHGTKLKVYKCKHCSLWHLASS
ncbi:hypothetical protein KBD20_02575 [Candidatus Saccharibacteria bacterium]|nr:hypothetical protein [Candidatus Saccharibacteria bacterium]